MSKHRPGLPVLCLMVLLALVPLLSMAMLAEHADHNCEGEGCEICACLAQAWSALRGFVGAPAVFVLGGAAAAALRAGARCWAASAPARTPVLLRVRMDH